MFLLCGRELTEFGGKIIVDLGENSLGNGRAVTSGTVGYFVTTSNASRNDSAFGFEVEEYDHRIFFFFKYH